MPHLTAPTEIGRAKGAATSPTTVTLNIAVPSTIPAHKAIVVFCLGQGVNSISISDAGSNTYSQRHGSGVGGFPTTDIYYVLDCAQVSSGTNIMITSTYQGFATVMSLIAIAYVVDVVDALNTNFFSIPGDDVIHTTSNVFSEAEIDEGIVLAFGAWTRGRATLIPAIEPNSDLTDDTVTWNTLTELVDNYNEDSSLSNNANFEYSVDVAITVAYGILDPNQTTNITFSINDGGTGPVEKWETQGIIFHLKYAYLGESFCRHPLTQQKLYAFTSNGRLFVSCYTTAETNTLAFASVTVDSLQCHGPTIRALPSGTLLLLYQKKWDTKYRISNDIGRTWSVATTVATDYDLATYDFAIVEPVYMLIALYNETDSKWYSSVGLFNDDGTMSFSTPAVIVTGAAKVRGEIHQRVDGVWEFLYTTSGGVQTTVTCQNLDPSSGSGTWT